eukprot:g75425.t1
MCVNFLDKFFPHLVGARLECLNRLQEKMRAYCLFNVLVPALNDLLRSCLIDTVGNIIKDSKQMEDDTASTHSCQLIAASMWPVASFRLGEKVHEILETEMLALIPSFTLREVKLKAYKATIAKFGHLHPKTDKGLQALREDIEKDTEKGIPALYKKYIDYLKEDVQKNCSPLLTFDGIQPNNVGALMMRRVRRAFKNASGRGTNKKLTTREILMRQPDSNNQVFQAMTDVLEKLTSHKDSEHFRWPVPMEPGYHEYHEVIQNPMDLSTVRTNLDNGKYVDGKKGLRAFESDLKTIWSNCYKFNAEDSEIYAEAKRLDAYQ